jgi:hypothetical protein
VNIFTMVEQLLGGRKTGGTGRSVSGPAHLTATGIRSNRRARRAGKGLVMYFDKQIF